MNGKPKNLRAAFLAAAHCTHPDTDAADKSLLAYLTAYANYKTGENSRPGNRNLADVINFTDRGMKNRLTQLITYGLLERTERGDGRGRASAYRLCWESPFYPDQAPGGEWLSDKPGTLDCPDSPKEPGTLDCPDSSETGNGAAINREQEGDKPGTAESETGNPSVPHNKSATEEQHQPTLQPQNSQSGTGNAEGGKEGISPKTPTWPLVGLPEQMLGAVATKEHRAAVLDQISKIGLPVFHAALRAWIAGRQYPVAGPGGLTRPIWGVWLEEGRPFIEAELLSIRRAKNKVDREAKNNAFIEQQMRWGIFEWGQCPDLREHLYQTNPADAALLRDLLEPPTPATGRDYHYGQEKFLALPADETKRLVALVKAAREDLARIRQEETAAFSGNNEASLDELEEP
jgi:hypothetical protein